MEGRAASGTDKLERTQQSLLTATCNSQPIGHSLQDAFPDLSACGQEPGSRVSPAPRPCLAPHPAHCPLVGRSAPCGRDHCQALSGCCPQAWLRLGHTLCHTPPPNSSGALKGGKAHFPSVCPEKEEATRKANPPHIAHSLGNHPSQHLRPPYSGAILLLKPPRRDVPELTLCTRHRPGAADHGPHSLLQNTNYDSLQNSSTQPRTSRDRHIQHVLPRG